MKTITVELPIVKLHQLNVAYGRTGCIRDITAKEISDALGFSSQRTPNHDKTTKIWRFKVGDLLFAIWDYKGSEKFNQFSCFGNHTVLAQIFGLRYYDERQVGRG